jgi:hypothetical protein
LGPPRHDSIGSRAAKIQRRRLARNILIVKARDHASTSSRAATHRRASPRGEKLSRPPAPVANQRVGAQASSTMS